MNATQIKSVKSIAKIVGVDKLDDAMRTLVEQNITNSVMLGMNADAIIDVINKLPLMVAKREQFIQSQIDDIIKSVDALPLGAIKWGDKLHNAITSKIETLDVAQKIVVIGDVEHKFDNAKSMTTNLVFNGKPLYKWHPNFTNDADWKTKSVSAPRCLGDINANHSLFNGCYGKKSNQWVDANGVVHANWNGPIRLVVNNGDDGQPLVSYKK